MMVQWMGLSVDKLQRAITMLHFYNHLNVQKEWLGYNFRVI
jgi:hypothetical protein